MLSARWDELPSYQIGLEKGLEQGLEQGKIEMVINMLPTFDNKQISLYSGLPTQKIQAIRKEVDNNK